MHIQDWARSSLLAALLGCTGMRTVEPERFIPERRPAMVAVWTSLTKFTIVSEPAVLRDTLSGVVLGEPWSIALKDVVRVQADAPDATRTALFVTGTAASVFGLALLLGNNSGKSGQTLTPGLNCSSDYSSSTATGLSPCDAGSK